MPPGDIAPAIISGVLFLSVAAVLILRGPLGKALARRIEGNAAPDAALSERVRELEQRLLEVEHDRQRVQELEERLDFAERLLSRGSSAGPAR